MQRSALFERTKCEGPTCKFMHYARHRSFEHRDGRIVAIYVVRNPEKLQHVRS